MEGRISMSSTQEALKQLDESNVTGFHLKTVIVAGMGFLPMPTISS
jgi:hypothetical protein